MVSLDEAGIVPQTAAARLHLPVLVRDLMTTNPVTVEPTATVKDIAQLLLHHDIRAVPVVDIGDQLVGVVSEADLVCREGYPTSRSHHLAGLVEETVAERRHHWSARAEGLTAGELMTANVITCRPDELATVASRRMLKREVRTLPVVVGNRVVGVLSRHDVLRLFDRPDAEIAKHVRALLADPLWAPENASVEPSVTDGVVLLNGTVAAPRDVRLVSDMVRLVPGVVAVITRQKWEGPDPTYHFPHDTDLRA